MRQRERNILRVYDQATRDEVRDGLVWYQNAHEDAIAISFPRSVVVGAGMIAALSPGLRWERNVKAAERLINNQTLEGLGVRWYAGVDKAQAILLGEHPDKVLGGNKVRAFYRCILNPNDGLSVCVDGHAYAIWCGRRITTADTPALTDRMYSRITGDYIAAARTIGMLPMQLQAITWCTWRRLHNVAK